MATEVYRGEDYPEDKIKALKKGDFLVWIHPDLVKRHGPFVYHWVKGIDVPVSHSHVPSHCMMVPRG